MLFESSTGFHFEVENCPTTSFILFSFNSTLSGSGESSRVLGWLEGLFASSFAGSFRCSSDESFS